MSRSYPVTVRNPSESPDDVRGRVRGDNRRIRLSRKGSVPGGVAYGCLLRVITKPPGHVMRVCPRPVCILCAGVSTR